jgi:hypothetical protein
MVIDVGVTPGAEAVFPAELGQALASDLGSKLNA